MPAGRGLAVDEQHISVPEAVLARQRGALLVEINPEPTELSPRAHLALRGTAGVVLPELVELIAAGEEAGG